jgi:DNA-binding NtrC family response regulator
VEGERSCLLVITAERAWAFGLPASGDVLIGRGEEAHLQLVEEKVSRRHALLKMSEAGPQIVDLGSQNGTWVNGEPVRAQRSLVTGDVITIGAATVTFFGSRRARATRALSELAELRSRAQAEIERATQYRRTVSLLVVTLGGATVTPPLSAALLSELRSIDTAAPHGPAEVLMLLPETETVAARATAERLLAKVAAVAPHARIGLATYPDDGADVETLLAGAREAAHEAPDSRVASAGETFRTVTVGGQHVVVAAPAMVRLYALIDRIAPSDLPVLVQGETGSGKELCALALHDGSRRKGKAYVTVNCAAIHESLLESEMFGHAKGAFTDAVAHKPGRIEAADGGTLFLDEVGELSASAQAKLLRVLETKRVTRLGEVRERQVDARIVAATNRDLESEVKAGRFRQDLYYRLSGARLWLPPLRHRSRELTLLAKRFLDEACARAGRTPMSISASAMRDLAHHAWPGNVRELKNAMEYVAAAAPDDVVEPWDLPDTISKVPDKEGGEPTPSERPAGFRPIAEEVRELERKRMAAALRATRGNRSRAAELIHMPRRTFVMKLKEYGLGADDPDDDTR